MKAPFFIVATFKAGDGGSVGPIWAESELDAVAKFSALPHNIDRIVSCKASSLTLEQALGLIEIVPNPLRKKTQLKRIDDSEHPKAEEIKEKVRQGWDLLQQAADLFRS